MSDQLDFLGESNPAPDMTMLEMGEALYRAHPKHRDPKQAQAAARSAINRVAGRANVTGKQHAYQYILQRTEQYAKLLTDHGIDKHHPEWPSVAYPQKWFSHDRFDQDPADWGERFGIKPPPPEPTRTETAESDYDRAYTHNAGMHIRKVLQTQGPVAAYLHLAELAESSEGRFERDLTNAEWTRIEDWLTDKHGYVRPSMKEVFGTDLTDMAHGVVKQFGGTRR